MKRIELESFQAEGDKKLTEVPLLFHRSYETAFGELPGSPNTTPQHPPHSFQWLHASGGHDCPPDPSTVVLPTTSQLFGGFACLENWQGSAHGTQGKRVCKKPAQVPPQVFTLPNQPPEPSRRTGSPRATYPASSHLHRASGHHAEVPKEEMTSGSSFTQLVKARC